MVRRLSLFLILSLLLTACGGAALAPTQAPASEDVVTEEPIAPTETSVQALLPETPTAEPLPTATLPPTELPTLAITETETPLPPLELPTEVLNAPARMVWDGTPTYPADSTPGFAFRVTYDPDLWAVTADQFGFPALGHRNIEYCVIAVTSGRGLPRNVTVEHDLLYLPNLTFDVGTGFENGVRQFVTYTGGDGIILTAFEVTFQDQVETCLTDAEAVLTTLRAVPDSLATPQPTP